MIIVIGPDKCGKSTVARALREHLPGWSYRHHVRPPGDALTYYAGFMADAHRRVIVDRSHHCGLAYGNAYRGGPELSPHEWRLMELMAMAQGALLVLLTDRLESIRSRWGSDDFDVSGLSAVHAQYERFAEGHDTALKVIRYTMPDLVNPVTGKPTHGLQSLAAAEAARCREQDAAGVLPPSIGMGSLEPGGFMIVAERVNEKAIEKGPDVQVPLGHGPAAAFFWDAIDKLGIDPYRGYYTNASEFPDHHAFRRYCDQVVRPSVVVTMGRLAGSLAQAARAQAPVVELHHPLYVRRFQWKEQETWIEALGEALGAWRCQAG